MGIADSRAAKVIVLLVAGGVSVSLGEGLLRTVVVLPLERTLPEVRYNPHPIRRFTLRPSQRAFTYGAPVTIDSGGFRTNGEATVPGTPTVLALGDSFTFGLGVRDSETWPARLQAHLNRVLQRPARIINAGTVSYGVFQEANFLQERGLATHPAVVIHALYWNDFMNASPPAPGEQPPLTPSGYFAWDHLDEEQTGLLRALSRVSSHSAFLVAMKRAASNVVRRDGTTAYGRAYSSFIKLGLSPEEWRTIEIFFRELKALGDRENFLVFAVILPVIDIVRQPGAERHRYAIGARDLLARIGVPYLDGFTVWSSIGLGRGQFLPQGRDAHLGAEGYEYLAAALCDALLDRPEIARALREAR